MDDYPDLFPKWTTTPYLTRIDPEKARPDALKTYRNFQSGDIDNPSISIINPDNTIVNQKPAEFSFKLRLDSQQSETDGQILFNQLFLPSKNEAEEIVGKDNNQKNKYLSGR